MSVLVFDNDFDRNKKESSRKFIIHFILDDNSNLISLFEPPAQCFTAKTGKKTRHDYRRVKMKAENKNRMREVRRLGIADVLFNSQLRRMKMKVESKHQEQGVKRIGLASNLLFAALSAKAVGGIGRIRGG